MPPCDKFAALAISLTLALAGVPDTQQPTGGADAE